MLRLAALPLLAALLLAALQPVRPAVLGIDVGGQNLKACVVRPGKTPIDIVLNEMGKRKAPAVVAFSKGKGERILGEEAKAIAPRYPQTVFEGARDALAAPYSDELTARYADRFHFYNVTRDETRGTALFNADGDQSFSAEELMASMLHYVLEFTKGHAKAEVRDAVLTVPPYYGQEHRTALLDAAEIAGMNVLALLNEHSAAALQYGVDKKFDNSTYVVLYDMGATNTWAALVEFSTFSTGKGALKKQTPQFVTRAVEWDAALGGQDFDVCLMDHFAQEFNAKHEKMLQGVDIRTVPKSMGKLRKEVSKTKETLSLTASVNAPCNVEAIYEDTDLRSSINPPKFHSLCAGLFERVAAPFERVLAKAADIGLGVDDIEAFELLGGATRIPRVVEELSKTLGGRELDRHLDSAEAVVFGTALHAANLSTTFRMRPFGLNDIATYPMSVSIEKAADEVAAGEDASASARLLLQDGDDDAGVPLSPFLPPLKIVPTKRVVSVPYSENDLVATLHYGEPDAIATLPPDVESPVAVSFNVSGVAELAAKYTVGSERLPESKFESANITKVKMHFGVDRSGLVSLTKAEALVEVVELVNVTIKPPKKKAAGKKKEKAAEKEEKAEAEPEPEAAEAEAGDAGKAEPEADLDAEATEGAASRRLLEDAAEESEAAAATEATAEAEEEGAAKTEEGEKAPEAPKWELKPKFKTFKPQLKVSTGPLQHVGLDAETMSAAKAHMQALNDADIEKQLTAAAKNNLESYAIETRSAMRDEDSGVFDVTSEEERDTFIEALTDAEDWLYMDGADEPSAAFKDRLGELRATGDAIFLRLSEREARPAALKAARKWIDKTKKNVGDWNSTKPYINATKAAALLEDVGGYEEWLTNVTEAQEAASALEAPVFLVKEVVSRREPLARRYERLKATPKPKPPKPKANATNATAEGEATGSDGAEAAAAEGEASTPEAEAGGGEAGGEAQAGAEGEAQAGADGAEEAPPAKEEEPAHDDELR